jgi:hypothetical protein
MKKIYLFFTIYLFTCVVVFAQHSEMHPEKVVVPVKSTFPLNPTPGTMFFDNTDNLMKYWNGSAWVSIAASTGSSAPTITFNITNDGFSSYLIGASTDYVSGNNANPTLVLYRGFTYIFNVQVSGHPFRITAINAGLGEPFITGIINQDAQDSQLIFKVPMDAPNTLYYRCVNHPGSMKGTLNVL